ncbi:50S ribosomal protein L13 [Candidatus Bathyarchaeota archaeon]|nr:50S ribosomal protein L13 [Candidatus Bathyarchaeota archaeon]NIU81256.1 50S ribosomal protein L13 [Candidatus Bathyarchaeota archaeon]NIV68419.1 50S ribosomal protein L13 [Candidatus Bathyarchaeota archaeon]NIW16718.1 50S ribosomal protein L13 [Candidatus Bathyarchaeota archaeon]NIW34918.1 50S ribosomal protein L13 [Candidatus Bathyarchaeota archaeon]
MSVIDANCLILGRMASRVAKRLLQGENIVIVNADKAVISGRRLSRVKEAKRKLEIGHPKKGPFHPRRPERIISRAIRGMLPRRKPRGRQAYRRLQVFVGVPQELKGQETQRIPEADAEKLKCPYVTVGKLAAELGWAPTGE